MKYFFFTLLLNLIVFFSNCQYHYFESLSKGNLKGKIKYIEYTQYQVTIRNGEILKDKKYASNPILEFDINGLIKKSTTYGQTNKIILRETEFSFDSIGRLKEKKQTLFQGANNFIIKTLYTYTTTEIIVETIDNNFTKEELIKISISNNDSTAIIYDKFGIQEISSSKYIFNKDKKVIKLINIYNKKTDTDIIIFDYDKNGDLIEELTNTSSLQLYADGTSKNGNKETRTYKYSAYDMNLNWTKMIIYKNGNPFSIVDRKIIYYN